MDLQRDVEALLAVLVDSAKQAKMPLTVESLDGLDWKRAAEIAIVPTPSKVTIAAVTERVRTGQVGGRIALHPRKRGQVGGSAREQGQVGGGRTHPQGQAGGNAGRPITLEDALETRITFGKNKDVPLKNLTINQLTWYAEECWFADIREAAQLVLNLREEEKLEDPEDPFMDDDDDWWV